MSSPIERMSQRRHNEDRVRRAESWLARSEDAEADSEEKFIFLWIAFNAAYGAETTPFGGSEHGKGESEREKFEIFLKRIVENDDRKTIEEILLKTYSGPIRVLMNNRYAFSPFWYAMQDLPEGRNWERRFGASNRKAFRAVTDGDVHGVLIEVFRRLYTLRNQILHGGVTYRRGWGRDQIRDGARIMASLVPAVLEIMRADIDADPDSAVWGRVAYPRFQDEPR